MEIFSMCKLISIHFRNHWNFGSSGHERHNFMNYCQTEEMGWKVELVGRGEIFDLEETDHEKRK